MSIFQLFASGPWMLWLTKLLLVLEIVFFSHSWTRDLVQFYKSGPVAEVSVAVGMGLMIPICLNGIYEGFDRGNWIGLAAGLFGIWYVATGALAIFMPHLLPYLPFQ